LFCPTFAATTACKTNSEENESNFSHLALKYTYNKSQRESRMQQGKNEQDKRQQKETSTVADSNKMFAI